MIPAISTERIVDAILVVVGMRVVVLGAGFGGMELCTMLSEALGDELEITLIDKGEAFVFGFSKLDVMFGIKEPESVKLPYAEFVKPGVTVLQETITAIDPESRRVTTDVGEHEADVLVVALGADYDYAATPGISQGRNEFYSVPGAEQMRESLSAFAGGRVVVGVCGAPFKCPPAPSETALMMHDHLAKRGLRESSEIQLLLPFESQPIPPSPDSSEALLTAFAERDIRFFPASRVVGLDEDRGVAMTEDGREFPYDLFLGVPRQRAPQVVLESGMAEDGYIPVDSATLKTAFPGVYAVGDVATQGTPKAGTFAESAAKVVASSLIADLRGGDQLPHLGTGSCYIEFGAGRIAGVDINFLSAPKPIGTFREPSEALRVEKERFGADRRARWFGRPG